MFIKIRARSEMLSLFSSAGLSSNPYSLNPICDFLYYEYFNSWLPLVKSQIKDPKEFVKFLISNAVQGYSAEKFSKREKIIEDGEEIFRWVDFYDEELENKVKKLDQNDTLTLLLGMSHSL